MDKLKSNSLEKIDEICVDTLIWCPTYDHECC